MKHMTRKLIDIWTNFDKFQEGVFNVFYYLSYKQVAIVERKSALVCNHTALEMDA